MKFGGAIAFVIALNAVSQIQLNNWQGSIYDAIGQKDFSVFVHEIGVFLIIVSILLCLGVLQTWLHERLKVRLRQAVTFDLLRRMACSRAAFSGSSRAAKSAPTPTSASRTTQGGFPSFRWTWPWASFNPRFCLSPLLACCGSFPLRSNSRLAAARSAIPGYMVWASILYAALGSAVTWLVGRPLIKAHTDLRVKEANFRFALVRVSESADEIALFGGERQERRFLKAQSKRCLPPCATSQTGSRA